MVRGRNGKISVVARHDEESGRNQLNVKERDAFQQGHKRVAIISDAASTGICFRRAPLDHCHSPLGVAGVCVGGGGEAEILN